MKTKSPNIRSAANITTGKEKQLIKKYGSIIAQMTLMDNVFLAGYFQDNLQGVSFVLQKLLNRDDVHAARVSTEHFIKNLQGRDVRFDVFAVDEAGKQYNIEIQRADRGAVPKRARYHSSMMDCAMLKPKDEFTDLAETVVIFITEHDVMKEGKVIYHVNRFVEETGKAFNDEAHIIYVNGQCQDDSSVGMLMHDFNCVDPEHMHYPEIAEKVRRLKYGEKEAGEMAGVLERLIEEERALEREKQQKENSIEFASALLLDGTFSKEKIAKMTKLKLAEVEALAEQLV